VTYRVVRFPRVGSTNDVALWAVAAGERPGLVVVAREQARGKGRKTRDWTSPEGGLWMSVALDPTVAANLAGLVPLAVGCAACEALQRLKVDARLRWPNDLMLGDRKLGGILVESRTNAGAFSAIVAGIGVNVANEPPSADAAAVRDVRPELAPDPVMDGVLDRLAGYEAALARRDFRLVTERFMGNAWGIDEDMVLDGIPCRPKEIAVDGALIVERPGGRLEIARTGSLRRA
jgi:BirA family biotin operon repressor/biotin-[acetyl-CoA-carboxylase] ligase